MSVSVAMHYELEPQLAELSLAKRVSVTQLVVAVPVFAVQLWVTTTYLGAATTIATVVIAAIGLVYFALSTTHDRIVLTDTEVRRTSMYGTKQIGLGDINSARLENSRLRIKRRGHLFEYVVCLEGNAQPPSEFLRAFAGQLGPRWHGPTQPA